MVLFGVTGLLMLGQYFSAAHPRLWPDRSDPIHEAGDVSEVFFDMLFTNPARGDYFPR